MSEFTFEQQPKSLPVINFDSLTGQDSSSQTSKRHGYLLPNTVRALVCGLSNCGKTNAVLALITHPNGLRFENVYVYCKSLQQPKYQFLEKLLKRVPGVGYFPFHSHEVVIPPNKARKNSLMLFDDIATSN